MNKIKFTIILLIITVNVSYGQFYKHTSIAVGLSTTQILGNNPGKLSIQPSPTVEPFVFGGGFLGAQPGLELRVTVPIDEEMRWRIPFGIDYQFYSAKERIPVGPYIEDHWVHDFKAITPYIGLSYVMQDLNFIKSKTYVSLEFRAASISNIVSTWEENYAFFPDLDTLIVNRTKPNATRIGALIRAGVEGKLFDPIKLNASVGLSLMNIMGRDDERRELLTPFKIFETKESLVWNLNFSFLFQYEL